MTAKTEQQAISCESSATIAVPSPSWHKLPALLHFLAAVVMLVVSRRSVTDLETEGHL